MRNFHNSRGRNDNFSRSDSRRGGRDSRYNNDDYKRPADKGFNRSFSDNRGPKPRRDYDNDQPSRSNFNQERRDTRPFGGGSNRSFPERSSFRNQKPERSYRNQTPPRSRDRSNHSESRFNRSGGDTRIRPRPTSPSSFRGRNSDFQTSSVRPRRGGISSRRGVGVSNGSRVLRRNDLRSSLIMKRSAPTNRSKEYIKKIKQARLKLSESSHGKNKEDEEPKTPPKEVVKEEANDENDEDFLDVANDVNFEEDEEWSPSKNATAVKNEETLKAPKDNKEEEKDKTSENLNASGTSNSDERHSRRERSEKSASREADRSSSLDLNCVHCRTRCSSVQDYLYHLKQRTHLISLKKASVRLHLTLNRLRKFQRDRQLEIEARLKNVEKIPSKYCQICKLYFRQSKIEHRESEDHKKIRNFIKPYCKICNIQLVSAMKFEIHKCTMNHLKTKARKNEAPEVDIHELDLGDFKTLDEVGDVDGEEVESVIDEDEEMDSNDSASVGKEFVNKVEVNYCSLCREYLPRSFNDDKVITEHCKVKKHIKWFNLSKKKGDTSSPSKVKGEGSDDKVGSASPKEIDTAAKKQSQSEKEPKEMQEDNDNHEETNDDESNDDNSTNFPRYYEQ